MKYLRQLIFSLFIVAGMSLAVSAQKGGDRPPKNPPPKIEPKPKDNPPKGGDKKPKKPGMSYFVAIVNESEYAD